ncbi:MAG: hypothetical protein OXD43_14180 [Bacteroidetes bacterium]|nr:hypothetical protein [Bacteroidota bacterium]
MNRITFLLGAGASIPAGYSSTKCLTKKIRASENYYRHTDQKFYRFPERPPTDYTTPIVCRIIDWLFKRTKEYFQDRGNPKELNYEDIYYLASQLRDDATELQNPALLPLIRKLKCEMTLWQECRQYCQVKSILDPSYRLDFNKFCSETCHYIEDIVTDLLNDNRECCTRHLEIIKTIHEEDDLELRGIATLAHDTHVERNLKSAGIKLADGFRPPIPGDTLRIWKNQFSSCDGIPFIKLHGSVNWTSFELPEPRKYEKLPQSEIGVLEPSRLEESVYLHSGGVNRPFLLIGTFNKPAQYSWGLMLDIHYRFRKILEGSDTLVVCGYSFGDKAINTQLIFWCNAERSRSLVVIDPRGRSDVINSARYAAAQLLNDEGTTRFITKKLEEVEPHELLEVLVSR